jgi:hypothetical protein
MSISLGVMQVFVAVIVLLLMTQFNTSVLLTQRVQILIPNAFSFFSNDLSSLSFFRLSHDKGGSRFRHHPVATPYCCTAATANDPEGWADAGDTAISLRYTTLRCTTFDGKVSICSKKLTLGGTRDEHTQTAGQHTPHVIVNHVVHPI